jgi:predicted nuclease with TOPRIM domain
LNKEYNYYKKLAADYYTTFQNEKEVLNKRLETFSSENQKLREQIRKMNTSLQGFHENAKEQKDSYEQSVLDQQNKLKAIDKTKKEEIDKITKEFYVLLSQKDEALDTLKKSLNLEVNFIRFSLVREYLYLIDFLVFNLNFRGCKIKISISKFVKFDLEKTL